jgi:hypothetical protein
VRLIGVAGKATLAANIDALLDAIARKSITPSSLHIEFDLALYIFIESQEWLVF